MFIILKKRKLNKFDVTLEIISACFRLRSLKPIGWLFKKGRYGENHQLEGNFYDYRKYCERVKKPVGVIVGE